MLAGRSSSSSMSRLDLYVQVQSRANTSDLTLPALQQSRVHAAVTDVQLHHEHTCGASSCPAVAPSARLAPATRPRHHACLSAKC